MNPESVIINGAYLVRSLSIQGSTLSIQADFNRSTPFEVIGAPEKTTKLVLNGKQTRYQKSNLGNWIAEFNFKTPAVTVPDLSKLDWHYVDGLPEISQKYDDGEWPVADIKSNNNPRVPLQNSVSLYGSDYGFHVGALIFRAHFTAQGSESQLKLWTQGGRAFASTVWVDDKYIGSFKGYDATNDFNSTYKLPKLNKGKSHVLTVIVDNMGLNG